MSRTQAEILYRRIRLLRAALLSLALFPQAFDAIRRDDELAGVPPVDDELPPTDFTWTVPQPRRYPPSSIDPPAGDVPPGKPCGGCLGAGTLPVGPYTSRCPACNGSGLAPSDDKPARSMTSRGRS
jgi:hypothetical protein